jgi:quercetin dioxygenase-like cupin family protein
MNGFISAPVPEPVVTVTGGVIRREYKIPAGMALLAHTHGYDHLSILIAGRVRLRCEDQTYELAAPAMVTIERDKEHALYALEDCVWDCLHGFTEAKAAHAAGDAYALLGVEE